MHKRHPGRPGEPDTWRAIVKATEQAPVRVNIEQATRTEQARVRARIYDYAREAGVKVTVATTAQPGTMYVQRVRE